MYRDLKLSDRARIIEMAVRSGITDLDTIESVYNEFCQGGHLHANGGPKGSESIPLSAWIKAFLQTEAGKKLAYRIGAHNHEGSGVTVAGILEALGDNRSVYDELGEYLWPGTMEVPEYKGESKGPLTQDKYKGIRQLDPGDDWERWINPKGEYIVKEEDRNFVEEVAKRNGTFYTNADIQFLDSGERYDAANYPVKLRYEDGKIVADAADLYDFDPEYVKRYGKKDPYRRVMLGVESNLMSQMGEPYIIRQEGIPVNFVPNDDEDSFFGRDFMKAIAQGEMGNEHNISGAVENVMRRLGNGDIEPAVKEEEMPPYLRAKGGLMTKL